MTILAAAAKAAPHDHAAQFAFAQQLLQDPDLLTVASCRCSS